MKKRSIHALFALIAALSISIGGCGSDDEAASGERSATPDPTASAATATPTATATATATATPGGEDQQGGGGDEAEARVPVALTVGTDGTISPKAVAVPAFLALELQVRNRTGGAISVSMQGADPPGPFEVAAGETSHERIAGVKKGRYAITVEGVGTATLVSGAEPGP
jgi:hypothetical protein